MLKSFRKLGNNKTWCNPSINCRTLFIKYMNDLHPGINTLSEPTIFTDDTSVTISSQMFVISPQCQTQSVSYEKMVYCQQVGPLCDGMRIIKLLMNISPQYQLRIWYNKNIYKTA